MRALIFIFAITRAFAFSLISDYGIVCFKTFFFRRQITFCAEQSYSIIKGFFAAQTVSSLRNRKEYYPQAFESPQHPAPLLV
jgi:hypothetical protein